MGYDDTGGSRTAVRGQHNSRETGALTRTPPAAPAPRLGHSGGPGSRSRSGRTRCRSLGRQAAPLLHVRPCPCLPGAGVPGPAPVGDACPSTVGLGLVDWLDEAHRNTTSSPCSELCVYGMCIRDMVTSCVYGIVYAEVSQSVRRVRGLHT